MKTIKDYFSIRELVCPDVYAKHGENAWAFLDKNLLKVLLWIREGIGKPMTINTWANGGNYSQRGLRCNLCSLVSDKTRRGQLYVSAHMLGKAVDFGVQGMSAEQVRQWLQNNSHRLPYPIRVEDGVSWVHIDIRNDKNDNLYFFKA